MTPWNHAESSAKKWGGSPHDYFELHDWFDQTKAFTGDWTHRALRHHSAGIQWAVEVFGPVINNSDGQLIPTKMLAEQHVQEDCGFIPTPADWLYPIKHNPLEWMLKVGQTSRTTAMEIAD